MWLSLRWQHNRDDPAAHSTQVIHQKWRFSFLWRLTRFHQCVQYLWPLFYNPLPLVVMPRRALLACAKPRNWHIISPKSSGNLLYDFELLDFCHPATHADACYRHPRGRGWNWCVWFAEALGWGQRERERERKIKPVHYPVALVCHFSSSRACLSWRVWLCRTLYLASSQTIEPLFLNRILSWFFFSLLSLFLQMSTLYPENANTAVQIVKTVQRYSVQTRRHTLIIITWAPRKTSMATYSNFSKASDFIFFLKKCFYSSLLYSDLQCG